MNAQEHFREGNLDEAIAAATDEVKRHPTETSRRGFLAELLCFAGRWERADLQLDALGHQDPEAIPGVSLFRQLIRAEQARQQFFTEGRLPEMLEKPSAELQCHLEASIRLREGHPGEAAELLDEALRLRAPVCGTAAGVSFDDVCDIDDLLAPLFEVHTANGKYYWIPMAQVESIDFHEPKRPRDLLWRRAHMIVRGGPDGEVFLPVLYPGSHEADDDRVRLGRMTDWRGGEGVPVQGFGQRMFEIGDADRTIMELQQITIDPPAADPTTDPPTDSTPANDDDGQD